MPRAVYERRAGFSVFHGIGSLPTAIVLFFALSGWSDAQDTSERAGMSASAFALRCPKPESPRFRTFECNNGIPDFERTVLADWNGVRRDLAAAGFTPTISYAGAYFGNTSNAPREGSYGGGLHASVSVDFGRLAGVSGLSAYLDVWWMQASNADAIFNTSVFPSNGNFTGNGFWVGQAYLQHIFVNGELTVAAGRLGPGATFATLPAFTNYLNAAINPNPSALRVNDTSFTVLPPGTQWGVQALYNPAPSWQGVIGVFNNNPESAAGKDHGLDWRWREGNRGVLAIAQLNWHRNQGARDVGMPGIYTIGGFLDGNEFATVSGAPATERKNWGFYAMGQQQVTRSCGSAGSQGLTLWATVTYTSRENVSPLPLFAAAGAICQGPFRHRPDDVASIGWYYATPSDRIQPPASRSQALELYYQYTISSAVNVVVDAQYLFRLNGYPSRGTTVLGTQLAVTF